MVRNRVLILGSKPGAKIGTFDQAYCANAASSFYAEDLSQCGGRVQSVISASELVSNRRKGASDKAKWLESKLPMLVDNTKTKIFLVHHDSFPAAVTVLRESSFTGEYELISAVELNQIQYKVTGLREPIWTGFHRKVAWSEFLTNMRQYIADLLQSLYNGSQSGSGLFRPSTGVISLIKAIYDHGSSADYEVAGIGIKDRGRYPDGAINTWTPRQKLNAYHVYVDRFICEMLAKEYSIKFEDQSMEYISHE